MTTIELNTKKMDIFRMILDVKDENLLTEIEELIYGINVLSNNSSLYHSPETLHESIMRSEEDFRNGRVHSIEDVRRKFPTS